MERIAIIGAGLAGVSAAKTLRGEGYGGEVVLVGEETHCPYDRPSLSKSVLSGADDEPTALVGPRWLDELKLVFLSDHKVSSLDVAGQCLNFADGTVLKADRVLLTTGARPRRSCLPGHDTVGVHYLRTVDDCLAMRDKIKPQMTVAIIGGGLIGCEVASTLRKSGADVVIFEYADELLLRVLGPSLGAWCRGELKVQGIRTVLGARIARITREADVNAVHLESGESIAADLVIVSIGAEPNIDLAANAGIACENGIVVDATGQTSSPWVFAAGDAAAWPLRCGGRRSLETYLNAQAQAEVAARSMLGRPVETPQVPVSWTEMAGHYIQMIGDLAGEGEIVTRGGPSAGSSFTFRLVGDRLMAGVAIDAPRDFASVRRLVEAELPVTAQELKNTEINLRDLTRPKRGA